MISKRNIYVTIFLVVKQIKFINQFKFNLNYIKILGINSIKQI